ncbi:MAG: hypothetical protein QF441_04990 [Bacteriovoracaceae bacterium]|jgi:hypothetical protein|nr:hypothetical protein [Halobacteriovoraceae bacterium]MDP7319939.1 hypothetical protein [Bacteriovoracaceae bacterium]|tara:strand:- start:648 stop:1247 length:600 start_codon:yes stop_codon:yes gene_type:complete
MSREEDDEEKSTVILDLDSMKEEMAKAEEEEENNQENSISYDQKLDEIEFVVDSKNKSNESSEENDGLFDLTDEDEQEQVTPLALFTYQTDYFEHHPILTNSKYQVSQISDLKQLNSLIKNKNENSLLLFYYNSNPKIVNQILAQLNKKFPHVKTVIIATKLSDKKAKIHAQSKYAAHKYLKDPFEIYELDNLIQDLEN